jgi:hypothetical protein
MKTTRLLALGLVTVLLVWRGPARAGDEVPEDLRKLLEEYEKEEKAIQKKAEDAIKAKREKLIEELKKLQDAYCRATKLDEALAIRTKIRALRGIAVNPNADPGNLVAYRDQIGKALYFQVTGRTNGALWGSDLYTDDSNLGTAAVHAGVLKDGQKGIVKVTMVKYEGVFDSSTRNGVTSSAFGLYPGNTFRVEAVKD